MLGGFRKVAFSSSGLRAMAREGVEEIQAWNLVQLARLPDLRGCGGGGDRRAEDAPGQHVHIVVHGHQVVGAGLVLFLL